MGSSPELSSGSYKKNGDIRVVMLINNNLAIDARVRKEAASVAEAGFDTHVVGLGTEFPQDLIEAPFKLHLAAPRRFEVPRQPRLGREDIWKPLRILVNLTITRYRETQHRREFNADSNIKYYTRLPGLERLGLALKPDILHCHDLDTLYAGYQIAQKTGALLIYDSHEIFLELHTLDPLLKPVYKQIEAEVFPVLDGFVTVSPAIGRILTEKYNSDIEPVVLYNGGTHIVEKITPISSLPKLFFQGAFATDRNNLELIKAMAHLKGKATLTLQGWGQDEEEFTRLIKELSLEDTVFVIPPCGPLEVVDSAANYDIGVINSKCIDENFKNTLPNKLFDYMCAGLAVASTDLPPIKEIVDAHDCGITYEQLGVEHTAKILGELVSNPERIVAMKQRSLDAASTYFWPAQATKLQALYVSLGEKLRARRAEEKYEA